MSTGTAVHTPPHAVAPNAIPQALRAIWNECCAGEEDSSVSRALTQNLIVVADAGRDAAIRALVDVVAARLPCRAFVVTLQPGTGAIAAEVQGTARQQGRRRDLVLEQIALRVPQGAADGIAGVVRPLLVNDIPTHCYWATAWPDDPRRFDALTGLADHTVVDSARFELAARELDALDARRRTGRSITDLGWLRLRPWRRALAEVLERAGYDPEIPATVTIRHGDRALAPAALLGRWLEQRLGADVDLEPAAGPTDAIAAVELRHGDVTAAVTATAGTRLQVAIETAAACFLPFSVPTSRGSEADLLAAAIDLS